MELAFDPNAFPKQGNRFALPIQSNQVVRKIVQVATQVFLHANHR
jgi:hypothetical protein